MSDLELGLAIAGWLLSGALGWWVAVRYLDKQITTQSLCYVWTVVTGPIVLLVALFALIDKVDTKVLKSWK